MGMTPLRFIFRMMSSAHGFGESCVSSTRAFGTL